MKNLIAARYDGERWICATYEDENGWREDRWYAPGEAPDARRDKFCLCGQHRPR